MTFESSGRKDKIVVTGGTEGIGRAIALDLVGHGHDVVICARSREKIQRTSLDRLFAYQLDLADLPAIGDFTYFSRAKLGTVNALILNAAVSGVFHPDEYTLRVNRDAQKILIESMAPLLRESHGRIVFLTSSQAHDQVSDNQAYGLTKRDVEMFLADFIECEENKGIRAFSINPGPTDTRMHDEAVHQGGAEIAKRSTHLKEAGALRDPLIVGCIIAKISLSGMRFNAETKKYDIPINNNEIVTISDENIAAEIKSIV